MVWCDKNENVLEWGSEEIVIPFFLLIIGCIATFLISTSIPELKLGDAEAIIEIKPFKQTAPPKNNAVVQRGI